MSFRNSERGSSKGPPLRMISWSIVGRPGKGDWQPEKQSRYRDRQELSMSSLRLRLMGYLSKVQLIERANRTRQFYLICPAPLAEALELQKGEAIEWIV